MFALVAVLGTGYADGADPILLTESRRDLDGDGRLDRIRVILADPHATREYAPDEGVIVSVKLGRRPWVDTDVGATVGQPTMKFLPPEWSLVFADYNHDGQIDFNLGQPCGSNNACNWLFTVERSGKISPLRIVKPGFLWINDGSYSTSQIKVSRKSIEYWAYEPSEGTGVTVRLRWDARTRQFVPVGKWVGKAPDE